MASLGGCQGLLILRWIEPQKPPSGVIPAPHPECDMHFSVCCLTVSADKTSGVTVAATFLSLLFFPSLLTDDCCIKKQKKQQQQQLCFLARSLANALWSTGKHEVFWTGHRKQSDSSDFPLTFVYAPAFKLHCIETRRQLDCWFLKI